MVGLSFLNKKSWHTGSFKNIEEVWLREEEQRSKRRREQEQIKKLKEEKQIEDLKRLQVEAGLIPESHLQRMDWMYQGGMPTTANNSEDYFSNQKVEEKDGKKKITPVIKENRPNDQNEDFTRMYEDPLFIIMKEEQRAKEEVLDNPVLMKEIRDEIRKLKDIKKHRHAKHSSKHSDGKGRSSHSGDRHHSHHHKHKHTHPQAPLHTHKHHAISPWDSFTTKRAIPEGGDTRNRKIIEDNEGFKEPPKCKREEEFKEPPKHKREEEFKEGPKVPPKEHKSSNLGPPQLFYDKLKERSSIDRLNKQQNRKSVSSMSQDEREERINDMLKAATDRQENELREYQKDIARYDRGDKMQLSKNKGGHNPKFITQLNKEIYLNEEISLEQGIKRKSHYIQRKSDLAKNSYVK